ncbi:MAG: hypothetical protein K2V38_25705 [Gemmataceae bacterium]|nr:hypothetical protein [Gemmataceae bacterium]
MADARRVFVVVRVGWAVDSDGANHTNIHSAGRQFVPVAAFADRAAAEIRKRELELEAARVFNPFGLVATLPRLSRLEPVKFQSRLGALVRDVPDESPGWFGPHLTWGAWWGENMPEWSDETLAAVWELFDQIRFYDVLEVEVGDE